jgi:NAD(P)-dependent dehydrogenase (short-subunit alcohol dehydrogenase family)
MRLANKVALITGGGSGMGKATARLFRVEGAQVAIAGRRKNMLEAAALEIGEDLFCCPCDITDEAAVRSMIKDVVAKFGRIDVMVHSAGINPDRTDLPETDLDTFRNTMEASVTGAFLVAREVVTVMPSGGAIVLIGSVAAIRGSPTRFSITAAKGALHAATGQMAQTLGKDGIRVNLVAPGATRTEMTEKLFDSMPKEAFERVLARHPLGKIGEPADIAQACLFLASDEAKWVTGLILPVDGGSSA